MSMEQRFSGGVICERLEGGRSAAELLVTEHELEARTLDGQLFSLSLQECEFELGGASGKMLFCRNLDRSVTIFSEERHFAQVLRAQRELAPRFEKVDRELRRQKHHALLWTGGLLAVALLLVLSLGVALQQAGRIAVALVPASVDERLGKLAVENMSLGPVSDDEVLNAAVAKLVKRLEGAVSTKFRFETRVVKSPELNAFALPGGPIVVYTGLLKAAETPEQLAGALAHEMAHVTRRHGMQRIAQSVGVVSAVQLLFGDVSGVLAAAVQLLQVGAINSYSREAEHEADMDAVDTLLKARLDARALAEFFAIMQKKSGDVPGELSWLGTHPEMKQRAKDVLTRVEALSKVSGGSKVEAVEVNWVEVRRRASL